MCKGVHLGFPGVLALLLLVCRPFDAMCQVPSSLDIRLDGPNVRLDWPATPGTWILESTEDLSEPGSWMFQSHEPALLDGSLVLNLPIDSKQRFFRLCTLSILFVDASNTRNGDGSFENPYKTLTLAAARARERFVASGSEQVIYVFTGSYHEAVHFDGSGLGNYQVTLLDSTNPIGLNGQLIGGEDDAVAKLTAKEGSPALTATNVVSFRLAGFQLTGSDGSDGATDQPGVASPAVISLDRTIATLERVVVLGGNSGHGGEGTEAKNGGEGGAGGIGLLADNGSTAQVTACRFTGGLGGNGGEADGTGEGGNGGRGGNAVAAAEGSTIHIVNSTLTGANGGLAGTPAGIFGGINGAAGSGAFLEGNSFLNISNNSTITGGDSVKSDINFVSGAIDEMDSTVDIRDSTIQAGESQEGIHTINGSVTVINTTCTGGFAAGAAIFADNTVITITGGSFTGGFGPVLGDSAFPGGFGLQIRGASTLNVSGATIRGGDGPPEETLGSMGGSGGVGFAFEVTDPGASGIFTDTTITGGNGGLGGGPFNGSGGEGAFVGIEAAVDFINTNIAGGIGSNGAPGGDIPGSNGGEGLVVSGGTVTLDANSTVTGGLGGTGDTGEEGGIGGEGTFITSQGGTLTINGTTVIGGRGGNGGTGNEGGQGGHGVRVGFAVTENIPGTTNVNSANVTGGRGGDGGNNGDGGEGGAGVRAFENGTANVNNSTITGGDGGNGAGGGRGGDAGRATDTTPPTAFDPGTINNNGSVLTDGTSGSP